MRRAPWGSVTRRALAVVRARKGVTSWAVAQEIGGDADTVDSLLRRAAARGQIRRERGEGPTKRCQDHDAWIYFPAKSAANWEPSQRAS